jgi:hypothetical protein
VLENHIKNEARHYYDECYAWDVVNEAFEDNGTLRDSIFLRVLGKEYIELAFKFARRYTSPRTRLYYNDYGIERVNNKSMAVAAMGMYPLAGGPNVGCRLTSHSQGLCQARRSHRRRRLAGSLHRRSCSDLRRSQGQPVRIVAFFLLTTY